MAGAMVDRHALERWILLKLPGKIYLALGPDLVVIVTRKVAALSRLVGQTPALVIPKYGNWVEVGGGYWHYQRISIARRWGFCGR